MYAVTSEIVEACKSCNRFSITIDEPLADFFWGKCTDSLVVGYVVTFEPVFYSCFSECIDECVSINCSYFTSRFFEFFECTLCSIVPLFLVLLFEHYHACLLEVISEPEFFPSFWNISPRIWYPCDHSVLGSLEFEFFYIGFYISSLVSCDGY